MANCYECLHYKACSDVGDAGFSYLKDGEEKCDHFKNKADFVEVVRCKDCKHFYAYDYHGKVLRMECRLRSLGCGIGDVSLQSENDFCSYGERKE